MSGRAAVIGIDASRAVRPAGQRTGTEIYSRRLIEHLARVTADQVPRPVLRLYSAAAPDAGMRAALAAYPAVSWRVMPFPRLWTHLRLSLEMAQHAPDLLFVPAHVLPLWRPRRTLVTVHDLGYLYFPHAHPLRQRIYLDLSTRWSVRVATRVLADSAATAADLTARLHVPAGRVRIVYPGFAPPAEAANPEAAAALRARYAVRSPYVLFVGTLQPRKNLPRLADAFARLLARWEAADLPGARPQLVLAGKPGWLAARLLPALQRAGLGEALVLTGYLPRAELDALLAGASALAFPSLYEGFGFPILEAQAAGVPVVTSTTSSCPEVAGDAALLVDPLDVEALAAALWRVLTEPHLRARLAEAGLRNVTRFSWDTAARQTMAVIQEMGIT